jgi:hypothetical protein
VSLGVSPLSAAPLAAPATAPTPAGVRYLAVRRASDGKFVVVQVASHAATWYVSPSGSDSNPGTQALPFLTLAYSGSRMAAGDTLLVRAGTYAESLNNAFPSGTVAAYTTVRAYPGETPVIAPPLGSTRGVWFTANCAYVELNGLTVDMSSLAAGNHVDPVKITYTGASSACHHIRLKNCELRNGGGNGVLLTQDHTTNNDVYGCEVLNCNIHDNGKPNAYPTGGLGHGIYCEARDNVFSGNLLHDNGEYGIQIYRSPDAATDGLAINCSRNVVSNNFMYNNGYGYHSGGGLANGWGMTVTTGDGNLVHDNVVYKNKGGGIQGTWNNTAAGKLTNCSCFNNTVWNSCDPTTGNHGIEFDADTLNCTLRNNLCYGNVTGDFFLSASSTGSTSDYNVAGDGSANMTGAHDRKLTNPYFNNQLALDFRLQTISTVLEYCPTQSACPIDVLGVARGGTCNPGAYETPVVHTPLTYYVYPFGSDSNSGTLASPFATLSYSCKLLTPGDTLYMRGGTYSEQLLDKIPGGTAGAPVTVINYASEVPILRPTAAMTRGIQWSNVPAQYVTLSGLTIDCSLMTGATSDGIDVTFNSALGVTASNHLTITNCTISGAQRTGLRLTQDSASGNLCGNNTITGNTLTLNGQNATSAGYGLYLESSNNTITGNTITSNGSHGVYVSGTVTGTDGSTNTIAANNIHDNGTNHTVGGWGVIYSKGTGGLVYNNLVWNNYSGGIGTQSNPNNLGVYYNAVYNNNVSGGNHGIEIGGGATAATNTTVRDNASFGNNGADQFVSTTATGSSEDHNVYGVRSGIAQGTGSVVGNPSWVSPSTGNFHLNPGSPCLAAGVAVTGVTTDYAGTTRGSPPSMNAYEA